MGTLSHLPKSADAILGMGSGRRSRGAQRRFASSPTDGNAPSPAATRLVPSAGPRTHAGEHWGQVDEILDLDVFDISVTHRDVGGPRRAHP